MTTRLAVGSVSTLAAGALLLGAAPYLFTHLVGPSQSAPWGSISSLSVTSPAVASGDGDRAQLLKLAALKTGGSSVQSQSDQVQIASNTIVASAEASPSAPASEPAAPASRVVDAAPAPSAVPVKMAAIDPAPSLRSVDGKATASTGSSALININTASTEALDHMPGAGRIGHAIVTHRPYRAINDLVRKRVLRTSDFQKIQSVIRVD